MPYGSVLLIVCCAVFYYRVGEFEYNSGFLLALISIALWLLGAGLFGLGTISSLLVQAALFVALWIFNIARR